MRGSVLDLEHGLDAPQARWLVDYYYAIQDFRIQAEGQVRAIEQGADEGTFEIGKTLADDTNALEESIRVALGVYAEQHVPGQWARSICGIGPVIAAGLLAHIDIEQAPTVGHIWRFAGLDPNVKWLGRAKADAIVKEVHSGGGKLTPEEIEEVAQQFTSLTAEKIMRRLETNPKGPKSPTAANVAAACALRPWNASLKVLCWKIGGSFAINRSRASDVYGKVYEARKELEVSRNESGQFADQAAEALATRTFRDKALKTTYESGMLPAGRIDLRARRYATKLFLAHLHHVMYEDFYGESPPKPYVMSHLGHAHFLAPPNWPMVEKKKGKKKGKPTNGDWPDEIAEME